MLTNADIHTISQNIRKYQHIESESCQKYVIQFQDNDTIELYNTYRKVASIPSTQLSDIHAILQLCHPNTPYYIQRHIYLSEKLPTISIYSYQHAPNILTTKLPTTHHNNAYIMQPTPACYITIQPDETFMNAIARIHQHIEQSLTFMHQYPHIDFNTQQLDSIQHIPHLDNIDINITAIRVHPSNIEIILGLSNGPNWVNIETFIIPTQYITKLHDTYTAHIHKITPKFIQHIQENFACSQHEKMRIIRQCLPYLTAPNNNVFTCIQECVNILMNHYTHAPPISPP